MIGYELLLSLTLILLYAVINIYVSKKIKKAFYIKEDRRQLHLKFIWFLAFIGPFLIRNFWTSKPKTLSKMTKKERKIDDSSFHESGKGIFGG